MMLIATLVIAAILQAQPPQPREPALTGKGVIRGQVTDQETGLPISRGAVTLRLLGVQSANWFRRNVVDHEGRFEFLNLPAGSYQLTASAGEHRATHAESTFGAMPGGGYRSLMLKDGEVRANVRLSLLRAFAVSGRVTDQFGDPLAGLDIQLKPAGTAGQAVRGRKTDDRGLFRVFGVPPGRYVVCANVYRGFSPRSVIRTPTERFVTTCHPSALAEADAQVVAVTSDVDGLEITVRRIRTFTVSGVVVDSTGAIAESATVAFHRYGRSGGGSLTGASQEGRFEHSDLVPGEYGVEAFAGGGSSGGPGERGYIPVTIVDADATDLVVTMKKPASVGGRIVFEDGPPADARPGPLTIEYLRAAGGMRFGPQIRPVRVEDDLSFTLSGIFDPVRLSVRGLPREWVLKSVRYRGDDITDTGGELTTDPRHQIEIVVTSRVAIVAGTVTDDAGRPAMATVFLIPAGATRSGDDLYRYRAGALRAGRFESFGVRAGEYFILALDGEQSAVVSRERVPLDAIVRHAERITLVENDRLTMNLRVVRVTEK